jgi:hypothetical protein
MRSHGARFGRMVNAALFGKRQLRSFTQAVSRLRMRAARHGERVVIGLLSCCHIVIASLAPADGRPTLDVTANLSAEGLWIASLRNDVAVA